MVMAAPRTQELSEEWFVALVQHSSDLIVVIDSAALVLYANPAALDMFDVRADTVIGTNAFGYIHPQDRALVVAKQRELLRSPGASITDTTRFVSGTGEIRELETVSTNCLHIPAVAGIVINGRDVTERNRYITKLESSFDSVTRAVANAVELRDPYTAGHQREVAKLAVAIATELHLGHDETRGIEVAATLHDIGKIAVPAEILTRPTRLTPAQRAIVRTHPQAGADIVTEVPFPWPVAEMILQHHERLDGSGYPNALRGDDILFGSRIVAVADVVSAISGPRPYRPALGIGAALSELQANRNRLYDPAVVDACFRIFEGDRFRCSDPAGGGDDGTLPEDW